jgi:hypothetical protein
MLRKGLWRGLAAAAAGAALAVLPTAVPAQAASGFYACPSGYFCGWSGPGATGSMMKTKTNMATMGSWDNRIISVSNRSSSIVCSYENSNYDWSGGFGSDSPDSAGAGSWSPGPAVISSLKFVRTDRECSEPPYGPWFASKSPVRATFGDMNGDGVPDVLSRDLAGRLWFAPGDGTGVYVGSGWNQMTALTRHGDFSGDGREDLLARDGSGRLWIYPGNGRGWFGARKLVGTGWNQMTALTATGDMNSDGRNDLLARDGSGRLWIYPGDGHGRYGARKMIGTGWNQMTALTGPGDLNSDRHSDLLARDGSGKLWIYPGDGHGRFGARKLIGSGWNQMESLISVGDTDGDGRNDLNTVTNQTYELDGYPGNPGWQLLFSGTGHGTWKAPQQQSGEWWELHGTF